MSALAFEESVSQTPSQTLVTQLDQARAWMRFLAIFGSALGLFAFAYAFASAFGIGVAQNTWDALLFGPVAISTMFPMVLLWQLIDRVSSFLAAPSSERFADVATANRRFWSLAGVLACVALIESLAYAAMTVLL